MKREQLVEIKRGQTGTGLLIESDGFIDINSKENKLIKESIEEFQSGVAHELPRPFVVSAVFQKYGIENANGRIYPEAVLKREVEKYQQAIKERRAYGECYRPSAMILTETGWKQLSEVNVGKNILTLKSKKKKKKKKTNQHRKSKTTQKKYPNNYYPVSAKKKKKKEKNHWKAVT